MKIVMTIQCASQKYQFKKSAYSSLFLEPVNFIQTLIALGANVNAGNYHKATPLHECATYGSYKHIGGLRFFHSASENIG